MSDKKYQKRIEYALAESGMRKSELAKRLNVRPNTITDAMKRPPRHELLAKIEEALNCFPGWLLYGAEGLQFEEAHKEEKVPIGLVYNEETGKVEDSVEYDEQDNLLENNVSTEMKPLGPVNIPLVGYVAADETGGNRVHMELLSEIVEIESGQMLVEVIGDSMAPVALHGQKLILVRGDPARNDLVVVHYRDAAGMEHTVAKRWNRLNGKVILSCVADPPHHPPIEVDMKNVIEVFRIRGTMFW